MHPNLPATMPRQSIRTGRSHQKTEVRNKQVILRSLHLPTKKSQSGQPNWKGKRIYSTTSIVYAMPYYAPMSCASFFFLFFLGHVRSSFMLCGGRVWIGQLLNLSEISPRQNVEPGPKLESEPRLAPKAPRSGYGPLCGSGPCTSP